MRSDHSTSQEKNIGKRTVEKLIKICAKAEEDELAKSGQRWSNENEDGGGGWQSAAAAAGRRRQD
jgi:hypothetical protein